jgi:hypothetical protein
MKGYRLKTHMMTSWVVTVVLLGLVAPSAWGQDETAAGQGAAHAEQATTAADAAARSAVPRLVRFSGLVTDGAGKVQTGVLGLTFALYQEQTGGVPLWVETQKVQLDDQGRYTILLGATQAEGLPLDLFTSGKARWLGVTPHLPAVGEQPRALLVGAPYALKAADAETLGGKPASAYLTADTAPATTVENKAGGATASMLQAAHESKLETHTMSSLSNVGGGGIAGFIPIWTNGTTLGDSRIFQAGSNIAMGNVFAPTSLQVTAGLQVTGTITGTKVSTSAPGIQNIAVTGKTTGDSSYGVYGYSTGNSASGLVGQAVGTGGAGVVGFSTYGWGVIGGDSTSGTEKGGVLGQSLDGIAVSANATGHGTGITTYNNTLDSATLLAVNASPGPGALSFFAGNPSATLGCWITSVGDLSCSGSKSAMVALDGGRKVALYAVESPENWFEDYGSGSLSGGSAVVSLDSAFTQTINTGASYHVFLTPEGECEGLYVANKTANGFEVRELRGGRSNVNFDYRIIAHRKGYENVRMRDVTEQSNKLMAQATKLTVSRAEADDIERRLRSLQPPHPPTVPALNQPWSGKKN